jgi:hypothetical protein
MKGYPCLYLSTNQGEFLDPQPSSKPTTASGFELHPGYIAMVCEQLFNGAEKKEFPMVELVTINKALPEDSLDYHRKEKYIYLYPFGAINART